MGCSLLQPPGWSGKGKLFFVRIVAYGKLITTFGATTGQELTAVLRAHAATKSVLVYTTALGGLERSFHGTLFWRYRGPRTGGFKKEGKGKTLPDIIQI
jgi:hypothetical protein